MEHSQNDIRLSFMSWLGLLSSLVSLVSPLAAGAQSTGEQLALSLRHNVVSVVAERPGRVEEGFGFIVGEREGQVFIVTANHVVRGDEPGDVATRVAIRYFHDQRLSYEATLLERSDRTYDIALLRAEVPNDLRWHRAAHGSQENVQRNAPVWFWDERAPGSSRQSRVGSTTSPSTSGSFWRTWQCSLAARLLGAPSPSRHSWPKTAGGSRRLPSMPMKMWRSFSTPAAPPV